LVESKRAVKQSRKGIYVLIVKVGGDINVDVGALGKTAFRKGLYAYVGSAQTNLEQRINRHLRKEKSKFWHIDYLLDNSAAKIVKVFFKEAGKAEECNTAKVIGERSEPVAGFGCSDCNCKSHLFHIENYRFIQETMQVFPTETQRFLRHKSKNT
jgi:Uri superfamily endonuclease